MAKNSENVEKKEENVEGNQTPETTPAKEVNHTVFGKIDQQILDRRNQRMEKKAKKAEAKAAKKAEKGKSLSVGKRIAIGAATAAAVATAAGAVVYKTMIDNGETMETLPEVSDGSEPCNCESSDVSTVAEGET